MVESAWRKYWGTTLRAWLPGSAEWLWGWALAIGSTIAFSVLTPLGKMAIDAGVEPTQLSVSRFGVAVLAMGLFLARYAPQKLKIDRRGLLITSAIGVTNGLGSLAFFWSLTRLDASVATILFAVNPLIVLLILALRGEKLTRRHLVRMALALSGVYLLLGVSGHVDGVGVLLVMCGVMGFTGQLVVMQWFLQGYDSHTLTFYVLAGMFGVMGLFWLMQGARWAPIEPVGWLAIGGMGIVGTFCGWLAMFVGIRHIGSGQVALLMPLETLLAVIWSVLFLNERMTSAQTLGSALILLSALLAMQRLMRVRWKPHWRIRLRV
ncbi:MAG: DMT family transporter [Caldilineaceae bacterium]